MKAILALLMLTPSIALSSVIEVKVLGLVCNACGIGIKKHLIKTKKVERVKLDVKKHLAYIHMLDNKSLTDEEIHKAIKDAGYKTSTIKRGK